MISIITPHRNDLGGLQNILDCLKQQTVSNWEWIIVDDYSEGFIRQSLQQFLKANSHFPIDIVFNKACLGPSSARNIGAKKTSSQSFVFLDSDDTIGVKFVENRLLKVSDFIVFSNMNKINQLGTEETRFSEIRSDFLENFLKARFSWQTTAILWNKTFFNHIGGFNDELFLLEDIALSAKALILGKDYKVLIDNEIDFYYLTKTINFNYRTFKLVSKSVELLIDAVVPLLDSRSKMFLKNYYYLSIRYFKRDDKASKRRLLRHLIFFKNLKIINSFEFISAVLLIFTSNLLSKNLFLKMNRKLFKKI